MWFKHALHNEKVYNMFEGVFELEDAQFVMFSFYEASSIRFLFSIKGIPEKYPKKWDGKGYNAINIALSFDGLKAFNASGGKINFRCSPEINSTKEKSSIYIKADGFSIFCESESLTIENITPYTDIRWD